MHFQVVSAKLSENDFDGLKGMVTDEEIERVKGIVENMDESLRQELKIVPEDIINAVPVDVILKTVERNGETKSIIEIIFIFHAVKNLSQLEENMSIE